MSIGLIMAGGFGKRLWPESKLSHPKQFLAIKNGESLIRLTYQRCINFFGTENTFIITRQDLKEKMISHISELLPEQVISEPIGKDTAACIGFATILIKRKKNDIPIVALPSDHLIANEKEFNRVIGAAVKSAEKGYLATIGIKPTRAETGYGYLQVGNKIEQFYEIPCYKLKRFTEKPSQKKAKSFLENGNFLWNAGIFAWRPSVIREELKKYLASWYEQLNKIRKTLGTSQEEKTIEKVYPRFPKISIDYAIMEKTTKAIVIPAKFIWDDIGEWRALERILFKNEKDNIIQGLVKEIETENCIFINRENKILGAIGVSNIIVINSKGGLLIVKKECSPKVKDLVEKLLEDKKLRRYME